jgi:hypothetical protein
MGIPKISTFMISIIWIGFFAAVFASFIGNVTTNYGVSSDRLGNINGTYNKLDELNQEVESIKDSTVDFDTKTGITDIIGAYFENGYKTLKVAAKSFGVFISLSNSAGNDLAESNPSIGSFFAAMTMTMIILFFVGILLSAIFKKDV